MLKKMLLRRTLDSRLNRQRCYNTQNLKPEYDAYEELVKLAIKADPSLTTLATQHRQKTVSRNSKKQKLSLSNKPSWLRQRAAQGAKYEHLKTQLSGLKLATVCQEAQCPNIGECWNGETGTATIMILGDTCTRGCRFCAVNTAQSPNPVDPLEPENTAKAVVSWDVGYIVITSVDRDDLEDGGANHFRKTVEEIKKQKPDLLVECLTPDFSGNLTHVTHVAQSGLDVFAHNIETVHRLQRRVRDSRANYFQSLSVLEEAKHSGVVTKSSIMLGLGETDEEIINTMLDLRDVGVDILTLGQYLQPTERHLPVHEFITPEAFAHWKRYGEDVVGFKYVASGPLVRSSYRAGEVFIESILRQKELKLTEK